MTSALEHAKALIARPSVTPEDAGCQAYLASYLSSLGFSIQHLPFGPVKNLFATLGTTGPTLCFVGHTDVVPAQKADGWRFDPFVPTISEGYLWGRGSADMKGGIAAMLTATERFLSQRAPKGKLAFLITSDEEGIATDGIRRALPEVLKQYSIDYALVGEPTAEKMCGDVLKPGRRGSLHAEITFSGTAGHVAYPHLADNPIPKAVQALAPLFLHTWDEGYPDFPPTSMQCVKIYSEGGGENVIPHTFKAHFNWRFSPAISPELIQSTVQEYLPDADISWRLSATPFYTAKDSPLRQALHESVVAAQKNTRPRWETTGGTSDGRFFAAENIDVVECGLVNKTIHQVNEHVALSDLEILTKIYEETLMRLV